MYSSIKTDMLSLSTLLNEFKLWNYPTYRVLEYFPPVDSKEKLSYSPAIYEVHNLTMEIEDGVAYCGGFLDDNETMLYTKPNYYLSAICLDNVLMVGIHNKVIIISLDDGFIRIEY